MKTPLFSFCAISRNEEQTLPRLIESLRPFQEAGGACCLLDTGSTDKTVEIARNAGWIVEEAGDTFRHKIDKDLAVKINGRFIVDGEESCVKDGDYYFDFAGARNAGAKLSPTDWVNWVDCDEVVSVCDIEKINAIVSDDKVANCIYEFVFSHRSDGSPAVQFHQSKMYNRTKIQWQGIVHEVISPIGMGGEHVYLPQDVYLLEHWQIPGDRHSYLKGLAVDCYQHPDNDRNSHYFARELLWSGRPRSAMKEFERHVSMKKWDAERAQSMIYIGDASSMVGDKDRQIQSYMQAFGIDPSRREGLIRAAEYYAAQGNWPAVISTCIAALEIPWHGFYANSRVHYEDVPHALLYNAYGWTGNIPEAQKHILKALEYQPYSPQYLHDTRYYFEYYDQGIDGWMRFDELLFLYDLGKQGSVCEVGSWKGRSTHALLSGAKKKGHVVTCVDTWKGSDDVRDMTNSMAKEQNIFAQFKKNTKDFSNKIIEKGASVDVAEKFKEQDMKFFSVFIDANHTKEAVMQDIRAWRPLCTKVLCGHDYDAVRWSDTVAGVDEALGGKPDQVIGSIWVKYL